MMTQEIIAIDLLFKRGVGDVAEPDFVALQDDMRVGETIKIMREKDVPSILVLECVSAARAGAITAAGDLDQLSHHSIIFKKSSRAAEQLHLVGTLTERDILYRMMEENKGPYNVPLGRIMSSPLLITIN